MYYDQIRCNKIIILLHIIYFIRCFIILNKLYLMQQILLGVIKNVF